MDDQEKDLFEGTEETRTESEIETGEKAEQDPRNTDEDPYAREDGNPYRTEDGASGYKYGADFTYEPVSKSKNKSHNHKPLLVACVVLVVLVALLISSLVFTLLMLYLPGNSRNENDERNLPQTQVDSGEKTGTATHSVIRNKDASQSVDKAEPIESGSKNLATGSAGDRAYGTISEAVGHVKDSVVEIVITTQTTSVFGVPMVSSGAGSGVIITDDGYIVTNNHVIEGANSIKVTLTNGKTFDAYLIGTSAQDDLAIIKIDAEDETLTVAELGCSSDLVLGESVIAIGNPLGSLGGTVTNGIVSALERRVQVDNNILTLLQTNAEISPGNSGGGLFNMAGQLIGIVNAKSSRTDVEGIGFAIPIDFAYGIIKDLMDYGYVRNQVDHGLTIHDITSTQVAMYYFNSRQTGVYCTASKYDDAKLEYGDRIISVDGVEVSSVSEFEQLIKQHSIGDKVTLNVARGGNEKTVTITLHEFVPDYITNASGN